VTATAAEALRVARAAVIADDAVRGSALGRALASAVDQAFRSAFESSALGDDVALLALGSYARRELCPGSDIDAMLLHDHRSPPEAGAVWYPLWDAGVVLGHSVRTRKQALTLAEGDLDALTALLETRVVVGNADLAADLAARAVALAHRRRARLVTQLADAAAARHERPGPVAEMLEPNLKRGAGGLRDVQALAWAGLAVDGSGTRNGLAGLVALGYLQPEDPPRLEAAKERLLTARVALHRLTGTATDVLALQDQDGVAELVGAADADALVRGLAASAHDVAWITSEAWSRLRAPGPSGRVARRDRELAPGVVLRDGRVTLSAAAGPVDGAVVLRVAAAAAAAGMPIDRDTLTRLGRVAAPAWDVTARASLLATLAAGRPAVPVLESLDHVGALATLVPEWVHVRAQPQRNAYHRFTVDRHLLEAVAEAGELLLHDEGLDGDIARRAPRDALVLGALLHDIGKGLPGDHSAVGAQMARAFTERVGLGPAEGALVEWLVANHLLLVETATRRDLSEERTIVRFGRAVGTTERLDLLYALTIADSRATGPAAWNPAKAALCRELFLKADALLERGSVSSTMAMSHRAALAARLGAPVADEFLDAMPPAYTVAFDADVQVHHRDLLLAGQPAVEWDEAADGLLQVTVVARDRTGLLATVAGVLALAGFDIRDATGYSHPDGMALEVFTGVDRFDRLADAAGRADLERDLETARAGELPLEERLADRRSRYRAAPTAEAVDVLVDLDASDFATVVEVHAPDELGLLARVAGAFAEAGLDVYLTKVATLGDRIVDVFYVRDAHGQKVVDATEIDCLREAIVARLAPS
jgi:[protein-PII] uridylyltransferase